MASSKEYLEYVLEQLQQVEGLRYRPMMGEYLLYCRGRVVGGVYDARLLVKDTKSARALLPGGREMLLVTDMENKSLRQRLLEAISKEV